LTRVGRPGVELGLPAATGRAATGRWAPSTCRVGVVAPGRSGRRRRRRRPGARRGGRCRLVLDAQRGDGLLGAGAAFARRAARGVLRGGGVPSVERYRPTSARRAAGGRGVRPRGRRGRTRVQRRPRPFRGLRQRRGGRDRADDPGTGRERRACPDAAYAPQPEYDGEGFRERYSCSPTVDGRLRLMRVWERGVIGVVYPEPADLDAHYAWFEGPQAPA
jgi:hypothetical protein